MKSFLKFNTIIFLLATILLSAPFLNEALSQEKFPSKPITIICPWEPGAGADLLARLIQRHAEKILGQPIIVKNKTGGAGTIGFNEGLNSPPDGYTLTEVTPSIVVTPYTVPGTVQYIKKFDTIILTAGSPTAITVRADAPWKTFKEFIDYAKANPGKIRISNSGHAAMYHIGAIGVEASTGTKFTHVPYKGSAPGVMALAGGHVEASISTVMSVLQLVKSGKLKVLTICSPERYYHLPEVPTFNEVGINLNVNTWWGFLTPMGTPKENIKIIHDAFKKAMDTAEFKQFAKDQGLIISYLGSSEFGKFLEDMDKQWHGLIEYGGFKLTK